MDVEKKNQSQDSLLEAKGPQGSPSKKTSKWGVVVVALVVLVLVVVGALLVNKKNTNKESSGKAVAEIVEPAKIQPAEVSITKNGFVPETISVKAGQAVLWVNNDTSPHVIASDPYPQDSTLPGLNSKQSIEPGSSWSYIFAAAGTFTYHDNLNPYSLKGTVIVQQ